MLENMADRRRVMAVRIAEENRFGKFDDGVRMRQCPYQEDRPFVISPRRGRQEHGGAMENLLGPFACTRVSSASQCNGSRPSRLRVRQRTE